MLVSPAESQTYMIPSYAALGLIHTLNPLTAGGVEPLESPIASTSQLEQPAPMLKGFGKIIRDETGQVLRIEMPEEEDSTQTEKTQDQEMREPDVGDAVLGPWVTDLGGEEPTWRERDVVQGEEKIYLTPDGHFV